MWRWTGLDEAMANLVVSRLTYVVRPGRLGSGICPNEMWYLVGLSFQPTSGVLGNRLSAIEAVEIP